MKHRVLTFSDSDESRETFALICQGFLYGGNSATSKGMELIRREAGILDKLYGIGTENTTEDKMVLNPGEQKLVLTQPEFELVQRYFRSTPWTTKMARRIRDIDDWLAVVPLEDAGGQ